MKLNYLSTREKTAALIAIALALLLTSSLQAQTGQAFIVSWNAHSFVPTDYTGKALPTEKTTIDLSFEILRNGSFVDLTNYTVTWMADGRAIGEGKNKKTTTFTPTGFRGQSTNIHILAKNDNGTTFNHDFSILLSPPELALFAPYPSRITTNPGTLQLQALPFFFNVSNVSDLVINWRVNGAPATDTGEKDFLTISLPSDLAAASAIRVEAQVQNPTKPIEQASRSTMFTFGQ